MTNCVVVANSSKARILVAENSSSPLVARGEFDHAESRMREQDLVSDGTGSGGDAGGPGMHSMGHEQAARQREAERFAREIADETEKLRRKIHLHNIYLVAPPKFLGLLRNHISKQCRDLVRGELNKDLVVQASEDIRAQLRKHL